MNEQKRKHIVIYHKNCMDGFTAAWTAHKWLNQCKAKFPSHFDGDVELRAATYADTLDLESIRGASVYVVDFSFKKNVVVEALKVVSDLLIIDHHDNAMQELLELQSEESTTYPNLRVIFDNNRSGAGLTWDYFFSTPRPKLVDYVEDRDIWKFALPDTREISDYLFSFEFDLTTWDKLAESLEDVGSFNDARMAGSFIRKKRELDIKALVKSGIIDADIGGYIVPVVNAPHFLASETCELLYTDIPNAPFVATYTDNEHNRIVSLRSSKKTGIDVSAIARLYGGNGHKHASGFRIPHDSYYMDGKRMVFLEKEETVVEPEPMKSHTPSVFDLWWDYVKDSFSKVTKLIIQYRSQGVGITGTLGWMFWSRFYENSRWCLELIVRLPAWQWLETLELSSNRIYLGWHNNMLYFVFTPIEVRRNFFGKTIMYKDVHIQCDMILLPSKDCEYSERTVTMKKFTMEAVEEALKKQE